MENSPLALGTAQTPILPAVGSRKLSLVARAEQERLAIHVLRGREAVLGRLDVLIELSHRTGQAGAMRWLDYQMRTPTERKKIPTLVLIGAGGHIAPGSATADDLCGAVVLYEYKIAGCGLKIFAA